MPLPHARASGIEKTADLRASVLWCGAATGRGPGDRPEGQALRLCVVPRSPGGGAQARVFSSALGIDREDWEYLRNQILARLATAQVSEVRVSGALGTQYGVPMLIDGLNGETHEIITAWNVDREGDPPRLITVYVNVP
jgi:hypothetical protein